jgi:hypothetical protein
MSLENMKLRLQYQGGNQQERMNKDKLKSLKKALIYSYQAATAKLTDGREFRCLINRNKLSLDLDDKIISIPFEDICLNADRVGTTTEGQNEIGLKEGDVFEWKENGSHWIVFLRRLEETAYFRADIRRCRYEVTLDNGHKYWTYIRGPVEQQILWSQVSGNYFNKLNYTLIMYIPLNEEMLAAPFILLYLFLAFAQYEIAILAIIIASATIPMNTIIPCSINTCKNRLSV